MRLVEIAKFLPLPGGELAGDWDSYLAGSPGNLCSLPVGYRVVAAMMEPVEVGREVTAFRLIRHGVATPGVFRSTGVTAKTCHMFMTRNSVYRIQLVENVMAQAMVVRKSHLITAFLRQVSPQPGHNLLMPLNDLELLQKLCESVLTILQETTVEDPTRLGSDPATN